MPPAYARRDEIELLGIASDHFDATRGCAPVVFFERPAFNFHIVCSLRRRYLHLIQPTQAKGAMP